MHTDVCNNQRTLQVMMDLLYNEISDIQQWFVSHISSSCLVTFDSMKSHVSAFNLPLKDIKSNKQGFPLLAAIIEDFTALIHILLVSQENLVEKLLFILVV